MSMNTLETFLKKLTAAITQKKLKSVKNNEQKEAQLSFAAHQ